jgi:putative hydroxymethylpyrimidine transport system ATP-binding protein
MDHRAPALDIAIPGLGFGGRQVLGGIRLGLPAGRWTALLGPSGSGKSTLLRLLAGLVPPPAGTSIAASDGAPVAGRMAWMAQQDLLLPWRRLRGNLLLGAQLRGERPDVARADSLIAAVGLAGRETAWPAELSGGMRQRAALARTLMEDRPIVLMDEPFSSVDAPTRHRLQDLAARLLACRTVLLVTHDPLEAMRLAHKVVVLRGSPARLEEVAVPGSAPARDPRDPPVMAAAAALLDSLASSA